jgi:large subunit ribosomal protein L3
MTHGSKNHREPGSIGMGTTPGRVLPGKKMAGQLGNKITTIKKLQIVQINCQENILVVKGSVPGKPGNLLSIVPSSALGSS